jgi:hypothetical protein
LTYAEFRLMLIVGETESAAGDVLRAASELGQQSEALREEVGDYLSQIRRQ